MLERPPALGQQREAAFAQASHRAEQCVAGSGINVKLFDPSRFLHRDVDTVTGAFVARIGQQGHGFQERPHQGKDILTGGGQVMDTARQHIGDPQRDPRRVEQGLDVPGSSKLAGMRLQLATVCEVWVVLQPYREILVMPWEGNRRGAGGGAMGAR